jgi:hemolysin activation/secretion protein
MPVTASLFHKRPGCRGVDDRVVIRALISAILFLAVALTPLPGAAQAQRLPGAADAGRIKPEALPQLGTGANSGIDIPQGMEAVQAPDAARGIVFILKTVRIEGNTALSGDALKDIYAPYVGRNVTLDIAWMIAGRITERYRNDGYFLSRAYVPGQHVRDGTLTIKVAEGYIGRVGFGEMKAPPDNYAVRSIIDGILANRPARATDLESALLRLNDLPGLSFRAVLSPADAKDGLPEGAVLLTLLPSSEQGHGTIGFDNNGSRFLGPNEVSGAYSASLLPLQRTTLSVLSSTPDRELKYAYLDHAIAITPSLTVNLDGSFTQADPGYMLQLLDITSRSTWLSGGLTWQWIRQRQDNLAFKLSFDGRNTNSDILDTPLTRDRIRALRAGVSYNGTDRWSGTNTGDFTISRGLSVLGSSRKGDIDLSRGSAVPDFTTALLSVSRLQPIIGHWSLYTAATAQLASATLYSAEEFGYGGQSFGRAFDPSDLTGDDGADLAFELRYDRLDLGSRATVTPFTFYDIGTVWNKQDSAASRTSGSSAGAGLRFALLDAVTGSLGFAFPLIQAIQDPIYGQGRDGPRIMLQTSWHF